MKRILLATGFILATVAAAGAGLADGWQALAGYRAVQAMAIFDPQREATDPAVRREARFGHAVALLDKQPVTGAQIEEARGILTALADGGTDDFAQGARFFLGRIAQHHQAQPDAMEAARQFRQLIAEHEDSIWAQTALSRLALLEIYELNPTLPPAERIAAAEKLLAHARTPAAESELHYAIASAIFFHHLPVAGALPHLLAAERLNRLGWTERTEVLVQIAELSRLGGDRRQAAQFYRKFLTENPRDQRQYIVKERLAALDEAGIAP